MIELDENDRAVLSTFSESNQLDLPRHQAVCPPTLLATVLKLSSGGFVAWTDQYHSASLGIDIDVYALTPKGKQLCAEQGIAAHAG